MNLLLSSRSYAPRTSRPTLRLLLVVVVLAMLGAGLALPGAEAAGPPYSGTQTTPESAAFFGPAPNPFPYCDNPTYFDPFPENETPIGRIDVDGTPNASVTTDGITMDFELTAEGTPGSQYPGFFPFGGEGGPGDKPKGIEMAFGDAATISLSEPLFYSQWIFTDVDRDNEGFFVTPAWGDPANPGQIAIFGGDSEYTFVGTTPAQAVFNDSTPAGPDRSTASHEIEGRVQVDMLGAVNGISLLRDVGSGQSGFAVGGGCEPIGVAKEVTSGPTWNGSSFDVTYTIRVRNNLPSTATISGDVDAAIAAADATDRASTTTGTPVGIELIELTLEDLLLDTTFASVVVLGNENTSGNIATNDDYNGIDIVEMLGAGATVPPETEEEFVLTLQYTPAADGPLGNDCQAVYQLSNQARVGGVADGVEVVDFSDDGADPDPGVNNDDNENDDPTIVDFECPPEDVQPALEIVKSVVAGPNGTCPGFDDANLGDGTPLPTQVGDTVTYCMSVRNTSATDASNVVIADLQAPDDFDGAVGVLGAGLEATRSFDLEIAADTPDQNTATANGEGPDGTPLPEVDDTAVIDLTEPPLQPGIALSKTVVAGADADCSLAVEGVDEFVLGVTGDPITWCFVITNTGDVELTNVLFTDAPAGISDQDVLEGRVPAVLAVAESIRFSLNGTIAAGGIDNVASVVGTPSTPEGVPLPDLDPEVDENEAAVNEAALELAKTVAAGANADCANSVELVSVNAGSVVTYCFTITNTGGVTVRVEQVEDSTLGVTIPVPEAEQDIAPGDSVVVTHTAAAIVDLVNIASVTGTPIDPTGEPFPDTPPLVPEDPAQVDVLEANLSLTKTNGDLNETSTNTAVLYTIEVANTGPDAAVNVVVVDTLPAGLTVQSLPDNDEWDCSQTADNEITCLKASPLLAGETETLVYFARVETFATAGQSLVNTATAGSDTPDPDPSDNIDDDTIRIVPPPILPPPTEPLEIVTITNPPPVREVPMTTPPLAITGSSSGWLVTAAIALAASGGFFSIVGRRRRFDEQE